MTKIRTSKPSSAGGGLAAPTFFGFNTIGAGTEAGLSVLKKITLPTASVILSVGAHVQGNGANVQTLASAVHYDASGAPGMVAGQAGFQDAMSVTLRWVDIPIGKYFPAGDCWIAFQAGGVGCSISRDTTGGADKTYTASGAWHHDASQTVLTSTTKNYSVRALVLPVG
jgi:hypothetical protein